MLSLQPPDDGENGAFCGTFNTDPAANTLPNANDEYMLCRFCAQLKHYDKELLDLAHDRDSYNNYVRILQFFKIDFVDLTVDSLLPKTTCEPCYNSMHAAYKFFNMVKQSQAALSNMYNDSDFAVKLEPSADEHLDTINSNITRISSSLFSKHNKFKSESNDCEIPFLSDMESNKAPVLVPLAMEPSIPANNDIIHTPSFGDLITDQSIDSKLAGQCKSLSDLQYSDTDYDAEADIKETSENEVKVLVPLYGGIPIFDYDKSKGSWASYKWRCRLCNRKCCSMSRVRDHGLAEHRTCHQLFKCDDCEDGSWNLFADFVEHVREHRTHLRNYCKYCDRRFESSDKCATHEKEHENTHRVCSLCGELCSNTAAFTRHKECKILPRAKKHARWRSVKKIRSYEEDWTWDNYEWTCQECCQKAPTVASLREHIQNVHNKCFAMQCVDCLRTMTNFRMFADHVKKHRPYLKKCCQYCNEVFSDPDLVHQHIEVHLNNAQQRPCDGCGQIFPDLEQLSSHMKKYESPRRRGSIRVEDITCDICQKICQSLQAFRQHRKRHDEQRKREYTCDSCGKSFYTAGMLKEHIKTHDVKTEVCEICKKKFHTKPKLKAHVATHSGLRPYTCDECGKCFRTDKRLKVHCLLHTDIKPFKCLACGKEFRYKIGLKVHENQHTGLRPYPCERCDKTFANWANCNKHMIRKHGITLAKTKLTALGRLDINRETGQPTNITADEHAREWMDKLINVKRGKGIAINKSPTDQPSTS